MIITSLFTLFGFIIILGFLGDYLFKKTGIPDILILMVLGLLLGSSFKVIDPSSLKEFSHIFSGLALMILLFEGGLNLNIYKVFEESSRAGLLAILSIITSMVIAGLFISYFLKWDIMPSLLLGVMVGGSSSSIVIPLIRRINVKEDIITLMSLESAFVDALAVVIGIAIIQLLVSPTNSTLYSITHDITSAFSIGAILGLIIGLFWLKILKSIENQPYRNILTLGIVFLVYSFAESLGGNGAISSLMFGLVLGNAKELSKMFKSKEQMKSEKTMKEFHSEISFLVRTFFFVYLGMIVVFGSLYLVLLGVLLSSLLLIGRIISVHIASINNKTLIKNRRIMTIMLPRGLAAAVLSQLPVAYGLKNANIYPDIVFTVITTTAVICTVGIFITSRANNHKRKKNGKSKK